MITGISHPSGGGNKSSLQSTFSNIDKARQDNQVLIIIRIHILFGNKA
jgi:hypothetical protein